MFGFALQEKLDKAEEGGPLPGRLSRQTSVSLNAASCHTCRSCNFATLSVASAVERTQGAFGFSLDHLL